MPKANKDPKETARKRAKSAKKTDVKTLKVNKSKVRRTKSRSR